MNIANSLSLLRVVFIIPTLWLYFENQRIAALVVFLVAAATDILDGWMARKFHGETTLGKNLDAIADKFLMLSVYVAFFFRREIPIWGFLVFARDLGVLLKIIFLSLQYGARTARMTAPTVFGKYTTFLEVFTIALLFINFPSLDLLKLTAIFSILSGLEYLLRRQPNI